MSEINANHAQWSSRLGFLLATVGAAVGLGSVWKFPYTTGANGGGAFVIIYLISAACIILPILTAELMLGRRGQASPPNAMRRVAASVGASANWRWLGWLTVVCIFLIMTFYSVIGGWVIAYVFKAGTGAFTGASATEIESLFRTFLSDPVEVALWHGLFMAMTVGILVHGVQKGIERACKIVMPVLFLMLLGLIGYAAVVGDMGAAVRFLFTPDFSRVTADTALVAIGLGFFTVGTGMALMMTYGSYMTRDINLPRSALIITVTVPVAALCTGLAIFPIVFANGLNPGEGPGLVFITLPVAFGSMPGGVFFGTMFFILLVFAALTSIIAGLEPIVAWAEEHKGVSRRTSAIWAGVVTWTVGLPTVFSFNIWADVYPLAGFGKYGTMTIFDLIDFLTSYVMLPVANIFICLFVGWVLPKAILGDEIGGGGTWLFALWRDILRYVAPVIIVVILVMGIR